MASARCPLNGPYTKSRVDVTLGVSSPVGSIANQLYCQKEAKRGWQRSGLLSTVETGCLWAPCSVPGVLNRTYVWEDKHVHTQRRALTHTHTEAHTHTCVTAIKPWKIMMRVLKITDPIHPTSLRSNLAGLGEPMGWNHNGWRRGPSKSGRARFPFRQMAHF